MPQNTGTHDLSSLLAIQNQSVIEYGMDTTIQVLQRDLAVHNRLMEDALSSLCMPTTDLQRKYGASRGGKMVKVDQYGRSPTQKHKGGSNVGFPLDLWEYAIGWTDVFLQEATPADLAQMQIDAQTAHRQAVMQEIKTAIFRPTNYTFYDHLATEIDIDVKAFVNADGAAIPNGPNGETFNASTHTHYTASASLEAAAILSLIRTVVEHGHGSSVRLAISGADEEAFMALPGFKPYVDPRIVYRASDTPGQTLDISKIDDRAIGLFGAAEVWVKPWIPENYAFVWAAGDPNKPLAFRQKEAPSLRGLRIDAVNRDYPLYAQVMSAMFGAAPVNRTNGAAHFFNGGIYVAPTFS